MCRVSRHGFRQPFDIALRRAAEAEQACTLVFHCDTVIELFLIIVYDTEYGVFVLVDVLDGVQVC